MVNNNNEHHDIKQFLSDTKFYESYARFNDQLKRYETWDEAVDRVMSMHREKYASVMTPELEQLLSRASDAYKQKRVLGAQRALQFGGEQLIRHQMKLYNCTSSYADRPEFFGELFYILLCGAGAGFSVQQHHVERLPKIVQRTKQPKMHVVEDSIEGWAQALDVLLSSYFEGGGKHPEYAQRRVYFDLSNIRPKGAKISGGFKAPGPEPLRLALDRIEYILQGLTLSNKTARLKPIHVYDIIMHAADAVLAGGVRRSATICLFSLEDGEMANAKIGDWFLSNPQRARSNNSAVIVRDKIDRARFAQLMSTIKQYGEPGFLFVESTEHTTNPCVTGDTWVTTPNGARQVIDLVNEGKVRLLRSGQWVETTSHGFVKTGEQQKVYRITLQSGHSIDVTSNHKLFSAEDQQWKEVSELAVSDKLLLCDNLVNDAAFVTHNREYAKQFDKGWLIGNLIGDGTFTPRGAAVWRFWNEERPIGKRVQKLLEKQVNEEITSNPWSIESIDFARDIERRYQIKRNNKTITKQLEAAPLEMTRGVVSGLFDADGCIFGSNQAGLNAEITSVDYQMLKAVQRILQRFGIASSIYKQHTERVALLPDGHGGEKEYNCRALWTVRIKGRYQVGNFIRIFEIHNPVKMRKYLMEEAKYTKQPYKSTSMNTGVIESIEFIGCQDVYDCCIDDDVHAFDANGFYSHNCVEIGMFPQLDGKSGWQGCNLTEINGGMCTDQQAFFTACEAAAILGTLQAGYTDFKFLQPVSKDIFDREALLGVSITGWMNNPDVLFDEKILKAGAQLVKKTNKHVAKLLGINPAARTTCVKPSGNASVLLMTASGIHAEHSKTYIRNIQMNKDGEVAQLIKRTNPYMVEESVWSSSNSDYVVSYPIIAKHGSLFKEDIIGIKHLELIKKAQQWWVNEGTDVDLCVDKNVRHNVSNTVLVDDWDEIEQYVFDNRKFFAGISFLSTSGDKDFPQAPNTKVIDGKEIVEKYGNAGVFASGLVVDGLKAFNNLWVACMTAQGNGEDISSDDNVNLLKRDWVRRFHNFADNYLNGNTKKAEYCLKDVYNLHKWEKIVNNFVPIEWADHLSEKRFVDIDTTGAAACVGVNADGCFI